LKRSRDYEKGDVVSPLKPHVYCVMKKSVLLFLSLLFLVLINACNDDVTEGVVEQPDPITPDLTVKVTASVSGFVADKEGKPVIFAEVTAGGKIVKTDEYGYFNISKASLAEVAGQVKVVKSGFFTAYKTFVPVENEEAFIRFELMTRNEVGTVSAASGGTATTDDGGKITLPANGVVVADGGAAYTGTVTVSARLINPDADDVLGLTRPGDTRGTNSDGHLVALKSYSTIAVELTSDNGKQLQLGAGKTATISLPIAAALAADAPNTIALWTLDTNTGLWKQEGTATKNGNVYEGTVSHFSFWEGAEGLSLVDFTARVVDASSHPLAHVPVSITIAGLPKNAGHGRFAYTDADGYVTGAVFANKDLVLDILTPCATAAYSHEFSTGAAAVDLGTLTGNLGQSAVTLTGTVKNCDNQPVASGYVQTYDNGFYNRIAITNGTFNFTGVACTNTAVHIVVVDNASHLQNEPVSKVISAGANDLGTLQACGLSTMGSITYSLDDGPAVQILEPADTIAVYFLGGTETNGNTQVLTLSGDPNHAQKMSFQFTGGTATGSGHKAFDVFSVIFPSGRGYWPEANGGATINITEYGEVGGFVSGNFTNHFLDFETKNGANGTPLTKVTCSFRIRRYK
jgi:hypothetical protein